MKDDGPCTAEATLEDIWAPRTARIRDLAREAKEEELHEHDLRAQVVPT